MKEKEEKEGRTKQRTGKEKKENKKRGRIEEEKGEEWKEQYGRKVR